MKNTIILVLLMLVVSARAQETATTTSNPVSKSGESILPAAGDFAIGIDALPYINFLGNSFNNTVGNTLAPKSTNLYLRYHLSESSAIRVIVSILSDKNINRVYVADDAARFADPLSQAQVEDKTTTNTNGVLLNLAYQQSRGYGKLRGIYGLQVNYGYTSTSSNFQYGNNITVANPAPTTSFGKLAAQPLEIIGLGTHTFGGGLLGGVEYYFLPKICVGLEIGLGYNLSYKTQGNGKSEELVGANVVNSDVAISPSGLSNTNLSTASVTNYSGLYFMFHF